MVADLTEPPAIEVLAAEISAFATKVDILVNNAGIELDLPFGQITPGVFDRVLAVNLRAPLLVCQALVPLYDTRWRTPQPSVLQSIAQKKCAMMAAIIRLWRVR